MRLLLATLLFLSQSPNPALPPSNNNVGKINTHRETQQEQKHPDNSYQEPSIRECIRCLYESTPTHEGENRGPYDPAKDRLYRCYLRFTVIGVMGGLIGIIVLICQSILLRKSTKASMSADRAYLLLTGKFKMMDERGTRPYVPFRLDNVGKTPAILVAARYELQIANQDSDIPPDVSIYESDKAPQPLLLPRVISRWRREKTEMRAANGNGLPDILYQVEY